MGTYFITTSPPKGGMIVEGNVGIGSVAPAGSLDVSPTGTICFGSSCKTSWAGISNYWSLAGGTGNVGINTTNTVGIGTTSGVGAGLVVMNGNVGIGTWAPAGALDIKTGRNVLVESGNVGIGTILPAGTLDVEGGTSAGGNGTNIQIYAQSGGGGIGGSGGNIILMPGSRSITGANGGIGIGTTFAGGGGAGALAVMSGNVGIGTWVPGSALNVVGNVGFGSVAPAGSLEVIPTGTICFGSSCKTSWASFSNYWSLAGGTGNVGINTTNTVGIGTTSGVGAGLVVMNGNVGIGTWVPNGALVVMNGSVGIGEVTPETEVDIRKSDNTVYTSLGSTD